MGGGEGREGKERKGEDYEKCLNLFVFCLYLLKVIKKIYYKVLFAILPSFTKYFLCQDLWMCTDCLFCWWDLFVDFVKGKPGLLARGMPSELLISRTFMSYLRYRAVSIQLLGIQLGLKYIIFLPRENCLKEKNEENKGWTREKE